MPRSLGPRLAWFSVCAAWLALIWLWDAAYLTLTCDDSFYVLKTAENIAAGYNVTFDRVNLTNGFHPLWMAIMVPIAPLAAEDFRLLSRLAMSLQVVLLCLAFLLLARHAVFGGQRLLWVVSALLTNFYAAKALLNGLEAALQLLLLSLSLVFWWRSRGSPGWRVRALGIGGLCGLTMLARLDAVFFGITLCAMPVLWPDDAQRSRPGRVQEALLSYGAMALSVAPYFAYNSATFHHLMPVSGAIKASAVNNLDAPVRFGIPLASLALLAGVYVAHRLRGTLAEPSGFARLVFPLLTYIALETAYNTLVRGVVVPEIWYLAPHVLLVAILLSRMLHLSTTRPLLRIALGGLGVVFLAGTAVAWSIRVNPQSYGAFVRARQAGEWIRTHSAPDALIAGWDCGIASAHSGRRFMNLDGLINSWEFKEQYRDKGRVYEFITKVHPVDFVYQYVTLGRFDGRHIGGIDFSGKGWHVVYEDSVLFRSILTPWRTRVDVLLILTPKAEGIPYEEVAHRIFERQRFMPGRLFAPRTRVRERSDAGPRSGTWHAGNGERTGRTDRRRWASGRRESGAPRVSAPDRQAFAPAGAWRVCRLTAPAARMTRGAVPHRSPWYFPRPSPPRADIRTPRARAARLRGISTRARVSRAPVA